MTLRTTVSLVLLSASLLLACKDKSASGSESGTPAGIKSGAAMDSTALQAKMDFVDGCVENAKGKLGTEKAFALCNCIYGQVQKKYGVIDSITMQVLNDTAQVAKMAANCK